MFKLKNGVREMDFGFGESYSPGDTKKKDKMLNINEYLDKQRKEKKERERRQSTVGMAPADDWITPMSVASVVMSDYSSPSYDGGSSCDSGGGGGGGCD